MSTETFQLERYDAPIGRLLVVTDEQGRLRALDFADHEPRMQRLLARYNRGTAFRVEQAERPSSATGALEAYFAGNLGALDELETAADGTEFQRQVWRALRLIPVGSTLSYGALAASIGRPAAVRAVGSANGSNPIAIVVPCHRVIGADASLTGYAGGVERKRWLLQHERARGARQDDLALAPRAHG